MVQFHFLGGWPRSDIRGVDCCWNGIGLTEHVDDCSEDCVGVDDMGDISDNGGVEGVEGIWEFGDADLSNVDGCGVNFEFVAVELNDNWNLFVGVVVVGMCPGSEENCCVDMTVFGFGGDVFGGTDECVFCEDVVVVETVGDEVSVVGADDDGTNVDNKSESDDNLAVEDSVIVDDVISCLAADPDFERSVSVADGDPNLEWLVSSGVDDPTFEGTFSDEDLNFEGEEAVSGDNKGDDGEIEVLSEGDGGEMEFLSGDDKGEDGEMEVLFRGDEGEMQVLSGDDKGDGGEMKVSSGDEGDDGEMKVVSGDDESDNDAMDVSSRDDVGDDEPPNLVADVCIDEHVWLGVETGEILVVDTVGAEVTAIGSRDDGFNVEGKSDPNDIVIDDSVIVDGSVVEGLSVVGDGGELVVDAIADVDDGGDIGEFWI